MSPSLDLQTGEVDTGAGIYCFQDRESGECWVRATSALDKLARSALKKLESGGHSVEDLQTAYRTSKDFTHGWVRQESVDAAMTLQNELLQTDTHVHRF